MLLLPELIIKGVFLAVFFICFGWNFVLIHRSCSKQSSDKFLWNCLNWIGARNLAKLSLIFAKDTFGTAHYYFKPKTNEICLTIDDCPGYTADTFAEMLDILKKHDVKVTLFITSDFAENNQKMTELLKRGSDEGHELANHMPKDIPYDQFTEKEFEKALI